MIFVQVTATGGQDEKSTTSAAASSTSGGSSRNLPLMVQVPQGSTGSLAPSVNSPTEEHQRLSSSLEMMDSESSKLDQLIYGTFGNCSLICLSIACPPFYRLFSIIYQLFSCRG